MTQDIANHNAPVETSDAAVGRIASLTEAFHRLGKILPEDQRMETIPNEMLAKDALKIMAANGFSQLPVCVRGHVLGVFSYRSFAKKIIELGDDLIKQKQLPGDLEVDEYLEKPTFANISDEFSNLFEALDQEDAILIGQPERLQGLLTAIDILRYLYGVASPFVLIAEIEICLRGLMRKAVNDIELRACCDQSLNHYADDRRPYELEEMTFSDYVSIIGDGRSWSQFQPVFRGTRASTRAKLEEVRDFRNDVFHFRREITAEEYDRLATLRDWIFRKAMTAELKPEGGVS